MSANNYILVKWRKNSYHVTMRDADTNYVLDKVGNAKKLETAIRIANDYEKKLNEDGMYVEYGLSVVPKEEKGAVKSPKEK